MASVSFLASRAAPSAGFWIALAGGVAVARAAQRRGMRTGYAASLAAMLQTVAIMGPARLGIPLTQAANAPLLGRLEARGAGLAVQVAAAAAVRIALALASTAFFIWVIVGGLDAYAGSYDAVLSRLPGVPDGTAAALALTAAGILGWGIFASVVQALVYRRGLRSWPARPAPVERRPRRRSLRSESAAAASTPAPSWRSPRWPSRSCWRARTGGAGGRGWLAGRSLVRLARPTATSCAPGWRWARRWRAARSPSAWWEAWAPTWRSGAPRGPPSCRGRHLDAVRRRRGGPALGLPRRARTMGRLRVAGETSRILDQLDSSRRLGAAGRSLADALRGVRRRPVPITDAVLAWVAREESATRA